MYPKTEKFLVLASDPDSIQPTSCPSMNQSARRLMRIRARDIPKSLELLSARIALVLILIGGILFHICFMINYSGCLI